MKAAISHESVSVTLTMLPDELELLIKGLGATSPVSREKAGMSKEQADVVGKFFWALSGEWNEQ